MSQELLNKTAGMMFVFFWVSPYLSSSRKKKKKLWL
jgi:hypothetical protein